MVRYYQIVDETLAHKQMIDHDTQGVQNWKADMTGRLVHWDTGTQIN